MGNEKSALSGLQIDEKPVEITDFWLHYMADVNGHNAEGVSLFISEPSLHYSANFGNRSPLEKAAKNLMLYRHPCILKYVSSWSKGSKFFLATEKVKPLIQCVETQNTLQICMGLYSILRTLIFLHEKAFASHNNVCESSVYVTSEGSWKLGGLECLCKSNELTPSYLKKIRNYRCEKAVSCNEETTIDLSNFTAIDAFAFGVLAENVLKLKDSSNVPGLSEFKQFCKEDLQNPDPSVRSKLSSVLQHPFFTHNFMKIYAFLEELPLKNNQEKEIFFGSLIEQLKSFPENIVAEQLGKMLLSRMVLLDTTAQEKLLPFILEPKGGKDEANNNLFTFSTFKVYLVPKLLQMFCIRDVSIRLVLLSHFNSFVRTFQVDELKCRVLPELLVGIKDTNDHLVCATLKALADIVPVLGSATVIGGKRGKLFTDGRPNKTQGNGKTENGASIAHFGDPPGTVEKAISLPERPSPDGGEDKKEINPLGTEEEYIWSGWDAQDAQDAPDAPDAQDMHIRISQTSSVETQSNQIAIFEPTLGATTGSAVSDGKIQQTESKFVRKSTVLSDISQLDIKSTRMFDTPKEEYDFFTDMEPVIKKTQIVHVQQPQALPKSVFDIKLLNGLETSEENNVWNEDLSDWDTDDLQEEKL